MTKLRLLLLIVGLLLLLPATARPAPGQDPQEGWQVYTNGNYVFDLALEEGGALDGGYTWVATWGGVVCYSASQQIKFTTLDGLADNYVRAIAADGGGRWWFGTFGGGVSVLDDGGTPFDKGDDAWTTFTAADGLASKYVRAIAEDGGGRWWFGAAGGVSVLDDGGMPFDKGDDTWITFTTADGLAYSDVYAIAEDGGGRWWFGAAGGVSVLDDGGTPFDKRDDTWSTFTTADGLAGDSVWAIAEDGGGRWWFGAAGGVSVLDDGGTPFDKGDDTWTSFTTADGLAHDVVWAIAVDGGGRWWFGTNYGGVSVLDDGGTPFDKGDDTWTSFTTADGLTSDCVEAVAVDGGGRLWFGTGGGVSVLDYGGTPFDKEDDIWTSFTTADGLAHSFVEALATDGGGRLWFGTFGGGVSVLDDNGTPFEEEDDTWATFTTADGLADNWVRAIAEDGEGRLWFGTVGGGASVLDDGGTPFDKGDDTWTTFTGADGLVGNYVHIIAGDDGGRLWFGTYEGVSVLDDGGTLFDKGDDTWTSFTTADGLAHDVVWAIAVDGGGQLWFGTHDGGVSVLDDGGTPFDKGDDTWTTFSVADGLADNYVRAIAVDGGGRMWFGTYEGVSVLDDGGTPFDKGDDIWTTFTEFDGLARNYVWAIAEDGEGRWWFGAPGGGVSVLDDGGTPFDKEDDTWTTFTTANGLASNSVRCIVEDDRRRLWFGTDGGVSELVDAVVPTSSASSPSYAHDTIPVSWTASDGASGVFSATLWVKYGSGGTWVETGLSQRGQSDGTFYYTPTQGDGTYYFATVAEDWMGNTEATPTGSGDTSTVYGLGDAYEPDDTCAQARTIPTDGSVQQHAFHDYADADWVAFDAISGTTYLIEAQIPAGSPADVVLELYNQCDAPPQDSQDPAFSPGVRLEFPAPADGPIYLKMLNHDPTVYGPEVAYHLSVRALDDAPSPGAVVIVAGKIRNGDPLQDNIHHVTNAAYSLFQSRGYGADRIHYLATDVTLDPDTDGTSDVDGLPTPANLEQAITSWAVDKVGPDRAFTLYLMDHGGYDLFYLNGSAQTVSPDELDGWLDALEAAPPGVEVNVIVEACQSGSFIDLIQTVSKPGRLVIASTGAFALAYASEEGAAFSDPFLQALGLDMSLYASFQEARWAVQEAHPDQTPWLDDDGDGVPNEGEEGEEAARRGFAYAGTLGDTWPPYVVWAEIGEIQHGTGDITAEVRDDTGVSEVWAVIYPPSYQPPDPATTEELVLESLTTVPLSDTNGDGVYSAVYDGFAETGAYRVVVYAVDGEGLMGRPKGAEVHHLYLPLVVRNYTPPVSFPVYIGDAVPARAVAYQGEVFYTTSVRMPEALPSGGRFYFSAQRDAIAEALVDDELAVLVDGAEVFSHRFSSGDTPPQAAIVEVPRATLEGLAGRAVTVEYRDVYGAVVEASAMWLIWRP
jgi:ligand-binding sensor domain-containing protein